MVDVLIVMVVLEKVRSVGGWSKPRETLKVMDKMRLIEIAAI